MTGLNYKNRKWLYRKYSVEKFSTPKMALLCGVDHKTITKWLRRFNIEIRKSGGSVGFHHSVETRNKISRALQGNKHPLWGKHPSIQSKLKMSKSHQGKHTADKNPNWKGGRHVDNSGHIQILSRNHPHVNKYGYIGEHRLVVEKILGRYLKPTEIVHHINGIPSDNRPENLLVCSSRADHWHIHIRFNKQEKYEVSNG